MDESAVGRRWVDGPPERRPRDARPVSDSEASLDPSERARAMRLPRHFVLFIGPD